MNHLFKSVPWPRIGRLRMTVAAATLAAFATVAFAQQRVTLSDVGIRAIGSHSGHTFIVQLDKSPPQGCLWGWAYCPSVDPECKSRLAIALMAKTLNKRLTGVWLDTSPHPDSASHGGA
jgi:hypothetical protein